VNHGLLKRPFEDKKGQAFSAHTFIIQNISTSVSFSIWYSTCIRFTSLTFNVKERIFFKGYPDCRASLNAVNTANSLFAVCGVCGISKPNVLYLTNEYRIGIKLTMFFKIYLSLRCLTFEYQRKALSNCSPICNILWERSLWVPVDLHLSPSVWLLLINLTDNKQMTCFGRRSLHRNFAWEETICFLLPSYPKKDFFS
jgi:hypothetical protein